MNNKEKNFVSAIVYVHNSEATIMPFLQEIILTLENNFEHSEIICVNDSSVDNSINIIKEQSKLANSTSISVINMSGFHGLEIAMNAGSDFAIGDFVFEFDNTCLDFSEDEIMQIYHKSLEGYDIVSASGDKKEKLSSKLFYKILNRYSNLSSELHTESFRILSRRVINRIGAMNKSVPYRKLIYANQGLKVENIKYKPISDIRPKVDKLEKKYRTKLAADAIIMFTEVGYRFSITMTLLMMLVSVFMTIYSIVIYLTAHPVAGWTTTILFLSIVFLGLFGILTIIIKYLQLLVNLVFKRKNYTFEGIEKITK